MIRLDDTEELKSDTSEPFTEESFVADPAGYALIAEIGRGGMGVVYRANDQAMNRIVAVKMLTQRYSARSLMAERFLAEAQITGRLQHPGVPAIYHVGRMSDGRPFLAMKLIEGETLEALLDSSEPLDHLAVFESIAQTVGYAHAHGVIHRDLKPANILVGSFGEVQVVDWGLAKVLGEEELAADSPDSTVRDVLATPVFAEARTPTMSRFGDSSQHCSVFGTPAYMAPEQAAGGVEVVDQRSDVFGLGAILCSLLTGRPPFSGVNMESVRRAAVRAETDEAFLRLAECGAAADVVDLCKRCLSPQPLDRPRDGSAVALEVTRLRKAAEDRAWLVKRAKVLADHSNKQRWPRRCVKSIGAMLAFGIGVSLSLLFWKESELIDAHEGRTAAERKSQASERDLTEALTKLAEMKSNDD